jgi:hypothetical protein
MQQPVLRRQRPAANRHPHIAVRGRSACNRSHAGSAALDSTADWQAYARLSRLDQSMSRDEAGPRTGFRRSADPCAAAGFARVPSPGRCEAAGSTWRWRLIEAGRGRDLWPAPRPRATALFAPMDTVMPRSSDGWGDARRAARRWPLAGDSTMSMVGTGPTGEWFNPYKYRPSSRNWTSIALASPMPSEGWQSRGLANLISESLWHRIAINDFRRTPHYPPCSSRRPPMPAATTRPADNGRQPCSLKGIRLRVRGMCAPDVRGERPAGGLPGRRRSWPCASVSLARRGRQRCTVRASRRAPLH